MARSGDCPDCGRPYVDVKAHRDRMHPFQAYLEALGEAQAAQAKCDLHKATMETGYLNTREEVLKAQTTIAKVFSSAMESV